jgi:hypothetical protein
MDASATSVQLAQDLGQIPSVTRILKAVGLAPSFNGVPLAVLERKRRLGQALHRAIQYDIEGALDEASVHPDIAGGFAAYRVVRASGFQIERAEVELIEPAWRVCGHPDGLGTAPRGALSVVDWKFSESLDLDAVAYQLAAYRWLIRQVLKEERQPFAIELHADGTPRVHPLEKRIAELGAEQTFLAGVRIYHAQQRRRRP